MRGMSSRIRATCSGAVAPTTAPTSLSAASPGAPRLSTMVATLSQSVPPAASSEVLEVRGAGVRRADEDEHPGAGGAGGLEQRLERVDAEVRVGGECVAPRPATGPNGRRRAADERLARRRRPRRRCRRACRRPGRAGPRRGRARRPRPARPIRRAQALEARELGLRRAARGTGRVDQRAAVGDAPPGPRARRAARRRARLAAHAARGAPGPGRAPGRPGTRARRRSPRAGPRNAVGAQRRPVRTPRRAAASARSASR